MTQEDWQSTEWSISKLLALAIFYPCKGWCLVYVIIHKLHLGLLQGPQPPLVLEWLSSVFVFKVVLASIFRRLLGRLYAIKGRSREIWANLSFDWRKCQCLFATLAMNMVWGLYVVTIQLFQLTLSDQSLKPTRQDRRGMWDLNKQLLAKLTMPRPYSEDLAPTTTKA